MLVIVGGQVDLLDRACGLILAVQIKSIITRKLRTDSRPVVDEINLNPTENYRSKLPAIPQRPGRYVARRPHGAIYVCIEA